MFNKQKNYILTTHKGDGIEWEAEPRCKNNNATWYTTIMDTEKTNDYLNLIKANESKRNHLSFFKVESSSKNGWRVGVCFQAPNKDECLDVNFTTTRKKVVTFLNLVHDPEGKKRWEVDYKGNSVQFVGPGIYHTGNGWRQGNVEFALKGNDYDVEPQFGNLAKTFGFTDQVIKNFKQSFQIEEHGRETFYTIKDEFLPVLIMLEENFQKRLHKRDQEVTAAALEHLFPKEVGKNIGSFLNGKHRLAETCKSAHQAGKDALNPNNNNSNSLKM